MISRIVKLAAKGVSPHETFQTYHDNLDSPVTLLQNTFENDKKHAGKKSMSVKDCLGSRSVETRNSEINFITVKNWQVFSINIIVPFLRNVEPKIL